MRHPANLLPAAVLGLCLASSAAAFGPAGTIGSRTESATANLVLLPGPRLLSPIGSPSEAGRVWKTVAPTGELRLQAASPSPRRKSAPAAPTKVPSLPRADSLKFSEELPRFNTALPGRPRT